MKKFSQFYRTFGLILFVGGLCLSIGYANAATVEVSGVNNPPTSFATLGDAVDYLRTNHAGQENVVNITTDGPIFESGVIILDGTAGTGLTINGDADGNGIPCTIITDSAAPGSQANFLNPAGSYCQLYLLVDSAVYTINDLILQPIYIGEGVNLDESAYAGGTRGIIIDDGADVANGFTLNLNNITIGGSKAGNVLAANPNASDWTTATRYDRAITGFAFPEPNPGAQYNLNLTRVRVFNTYHDAVHLGNRYTNINIKEGCIFAWAGRHCLSIDANYAVLNINGTEQERILIRGSAQDTSIAATTRRLGLRVVGSSANDIPFTWESMSYVDSIENGYENEMGRTCGPFVMENCFFAFNDRINTSNPDGRFTGLRYGYGYLAGVVGSATERTIRNCTFYDTRAPGSVQRGINLYGQMNGYVFNLENVVIAGPDDNGIDMRAGANSVLNVSHSALVTVGPDALANAFTGSYDGPGTGNFALYTSNVINDDPMFASYTYTYGDTENFLKVTNTAYQTAGPGGGLLTGAVGWSPLSVESWDQY